MKKLFILGFALCMTALQAVQLAGQNCDPNNLPWIQSWIAEQEAQNACCFATSLVGYSLGPDFYFVSTPGEANPFEPCPTDLPITIYNCSGTVECFIGMKPDPSCNTLYMQLTAPVQIWSCEQNNVCIDTSLIDSTVVCIAILAPVCGCNGVTYNNECIAQNLGGVTSWTPGECGNNNCNPAINPMVQDIIAAIESGQELCVCTIAQYNYMGQTVFLFDALDYCNGFDFPDNVADCGGTIICCMDGKCGGCIDWDQAQLVNIIYECSAPATISLIDDEIICDLDSNVTICPLENDVFENVASPSPWVLQTTSHGILYQSNDCYIYTPTLGFIGSDSFTYQICDNNGNHCDTAMVSINVTDINGITVSDLASLAKVFPNPFTTHLFIESGSSRLMGWCVYDILGRRLMQSAPPDAHKISVNMSALSRGIYFIHILTEGAMQYIRIEKTEP